MDVFWLEQRQADLPATDWWLCAAEIARMDSMRVPKRRADWRLGRWTAKQAYAAYVGQPDDPPFLSDIEIRPAASGAPEIFLAHKPAEVSISITHCAAKAVCAITASGAVLGCDMEMIEPRSDAFLADYFTDEEQALFANTPARRDLLAALLWSAKESALKALQDGLRLDTRCVRVIPDDVACGDENSWRSLLVRCAGGQTLHGWWQFTDQIVRTLVSAPPPKAPSLLNKL